MYTQCVYTPYKTSHSIVSGCRCAASVEFFMNFQMYFSKSTAGKLQAKFQCQNYSEKTESLWISNGRDLGSGFQHIEKQLFILLHYVLAWASRCCMTSCIELFQQPAHNVRDGYGKPTVLCFRRKKTPGLVVFLNFGPTGATDDSSLIPEKVLHEPTN